MTAHDNKSGNGNDAPRGRGGYPDDAYAGGVASGQKQGLRQPDDDKRVEDALDTVRLRDSGAAVEDQNRDKGSKGVRGGFDDSVDDDAGQGQVSDEDVARSPRDT